MASANLGLIDLDLTLLAELLDLPKGARIERVFDDPAMNDNSVTLRVSGTGMPVVYSGTSIPYVSRHGDEWR